MLEGGTLERLDLDLDLSDLDAPRCEADRHEGPHQESLECGLVAVTAVYAQCIDASGTICQPLADALHHVLAADRIIDPHNCAVCRRPIVECWRELVL